MGRHSLGWQTLKRGLLARRPARLLLWATAASCLIGASWLSLQVLRLYRTDSRPDPESLTRSVVEQGKWRVSHLRAAGSDDGRIVLFVHGVPGQALDFSRYLTDPIPGLVSIAVDRPGFGRTLPPMSEPSLKEQALVLSSLLGPAGTEQPILVGHSMGGPIVARMAVDFPERVGGIVLVAGSLDPKLEERLWIQEIGALWPIRVLLPRWLRHTNEELMALRDELVLLRPLLKSISCPIVIVHGTSDSLVPFENVDFMQAHFPPEKVQETIVLEGANHFLPWNSAPVIRKAIRSLAFATN